MHGHDGQTKMAHRSLQVLSVLLVNLPKAGFMCLSLLPQCILHSVVDIIPHSMQIALQQLRRSYIIGCLYYHASMLFANVAVEDLVTVQVKVQKQGC